MMFLRNLNVLQRATYLGLKLIRENNLHSANFYNLNKKIQETGTAAFCISTIVLGVDNTNLRNQLDEKNELTKPTTQKPPTTAGTTTTTVETTTTESPNMSKYRLPTSVIPTSYDLFLYPDLNSGFFNGQIIAQSTIREKCNEIVMHSHQLTITAVKVDEQECNFETDTTYELLTITKPDGSEFSEAADVKISVSFRGNMSEKIVGLYMSSYINAENQRKYIVTSKFEPTYARQAFPCFDEPNLKAKYKVHLLKPADNDYVALSNYPQSSEEETPEGKLVHFEETVPMSTYLACFIVSDFKYTAMEFMNGDSPIPFRVYASPGQLDKTSYAGKVGKDCIEYYIKYFNIPYPLPKLDMVAIPDFVSGAMEHWGLVTYRETALLYNETTHSASNKQRVAEVVAHELAHSWFGNLVTMDWWDNLWLNEGFASYIQYKGVDTAHPHWKMMDQFLIKTLHSVLSLDATQGTHPIIQTVTTPDEITEVFDTISYNKGAAVLRMLEYVVGSDNFQKGVTNYLNKHEYSNAVTQDLWDELQAVVGNGLNVTEFMNTFTIQMGYPILSIKVVGDNYVITQKRFLKDYGTLLQQKSSPLNYKWNVPITFITDSNTQASINWLDHNAEQLTIAKPAGAKWVKFNPNQVGYYRVNYVEEDWLNLINNFNDLSAADRAHLLEESFSIAESGDLSYTIPLEMTKKLISETEYVPWSVASQALQKISMYLQNSKYDQDFKNYVIGLLTPIYDKLGWQDTVDDKDHVENLARVVVLNLACVFDHPDALFEATNRFTDWMENGTEISPNLRTIVYKYGMVTADKDTWSLLFDKFDEESDANEKLKLMDGLATVRNPSLLTRLIELAKDETYVRGQDYFTLLTYISANPVGAPIVWDYVRENWEELVYRFTLNNRYLGRLIPSITARFSTNIKIDEMLQFFAKHSDAGAGAAARKQALETVENNIKWLQKYKKTIEDWIVKQNT